MKKRLVLFLLLAACFIASGINVRDFGARGDGKTDDTDAIQKAVFHLSSKIKMQRFRHEDGWYNGSSETHVDELYFPAGTYVISHTIFANGSVAWRGDKGTRIVMKDPKKDLLYCHIYRRAFFENIEFVGGRVQLQLWSRNWNASSVNIRNCIFRNSSAPALRSISRREAEPKDGAYKNWKKNVKLIPTYTVTIRNGRPEFKENSLAGSKYWYASNIIYVVDSKFINCMHAMELDNDGTLLDRCFIKVNPAMKGAAIISGLGPAPDMLAIWNLKAEAPASPNKQYWIDKEGFHLSCNDSVFKSVNPMMAVRQDTQRTKGHPIPGSVTFNRCSFESKSAPEALIDIYRVPCVLKMVDNKCNFKTKLAKWRVNPDQKYIAKNSFPGRHQGIKWNEKLKYNFIVAGNKNIETNIPAIFKRFTYQDNKLLHNNVPRRKEISLPEAELKAADFGVVGDEVTDNTKALTAALKKAAAERKTLVIPSGKIRLASTVILPSFVSLRGEGMPVIFGDKRGKYDLFKSPDGEIAAFRNLLLRNADTILDFKLSKKSKLVSFQNCMIYDTGVQSIKMRGGKNDCQFRAAGTLWNGAGGIDTQCRYNEVVLCWMANNFWMDDMAFFTARKGTTVLMRSPFFVPYVSKGIKRTNKITGETKVWDIGGNLRWIDNEGADVYVHTARGGGEAGGYCTLRQIADGGTVYMEGGLGRFTNPDTSNCLFYAAAAPKEILMTGIAGYPVSRLLGVDQYLWMKAPGVKKFPVYVLGVMYSNER